jgi:spermidine/putrescine transport system substrate-binding protein
MVALPASYTKAESTLRYMCWEGYNDPKVISSFEKQHQVQLDIELIVDSPAGFSTLLAAMEHAFDVVSIDSPWVSLMGQQKLCHPLDLDEFEDVFSDLYEQFSHPFTPLIQHGQISGIPSRWGLIGPTINTLYSNEQEFESYAPCFNPKYRGKIGIMDWGDWPIMPIALYAGINPYQQLDEQQLKEIRKTVRALFKNKPVFFSDPSLAQQSLLDGSIKSLIGTGTFISSSLRKAGFRQIKTVVPTPMDGLKQSIIWLEASAITTKSANTELSKKLLKHLVSTQAAFDLSLTDYACNLSTNRHVEALYTPDQRSILQLDDAKNAWDKSFFHKLSPSITALLALWQEELFLSDLL